MEELANGDNVTLKTAAQMVAIFAAANMFTDCDNRNQQAEVLDEATGAAADVTETTFTFVKNPDTADETRQIGMPVSIIASFETPQ